MQAWERARERGKFRLTPRLLNKLLGRLWYNYRGTITKLEKVGISWVSLQTFWVWNACGNSQTSEWTSGWEIQTGEIIRTQLLSQSHWNGWCLLKQVQSEKRGPRTEPQGTQFSEGIRKSSQKASRKTMEFTLGDKWQLFTAWTGSRKGHQRGMEITSNRHCKRHAGPEEEERGERNREAEGLRAWHYGQRFSGRRETLQGLHSREVGGEVIPFPPKNQEPSVLPQLTKSESQRGPRPPESHTQWLVSRWTGFRLELLSNNHLKFSIVN